MIPDGLVEQVRDRADIVELVGEHVPLKKAGKDYRGLCPFHQEKTPSFYVVPAKGFYKCFGCGESGDVFTFLMKRAGLGFQDAVRQVATRVGIEIPEPGRAREADEAHKHLFEAVAFAAEFYGRQLRDEAAGDHARRYLEARGIAAVAGERFLLGYALDDWRALREAAHRHGIDDAVLLEAGLVKESEKTDEPYDRLRDRLVFPITDTGGRVIAFGGRVLDRAPEGTPKYLNSPETPIYHKGRVLYGLHWSRSAIRREEAVLVVEGYMDYVSLAARGIENVVAPLGTAMTAEQAALAARYSRHALLLYDSDAAGLRATFRTADALLRAGVHPLVVSLPPGEDPDSVVRAGGAAALRPYLDSAVDVLDRKFQILEERGYLEEIDGIRKAIDGLLPTLRATADPALRDIYVARVAERTGVRRATLERELDGDAPGIRFARPSAGAAPESEPREAAAAERLLLLLLLQAPDRVARVAETVQPDEFRDPLHREIFAAVVRAGGHSGKGAEALALSESARRRLERLLDDPETLSDWDRIFADALGTMRAEALLERLDELDRAMAFAGGEEEEMALLREWAEVAQTLRTMGYKVSRRLRRFRERARQARPGPQTQEG